MATPATAKPRPASLRWLSAHAQTLLLLGLLLVLGGAGLRWLGAANTDLPDSQGFERDAHELYLPHATHTLDETLGNPRLLENAWKLAWLKVNGQWDSRLLSLGSLGVQLIALAVLAIILASIFSARTVALLMGAAAMVIVLSPLGPRPVPEAAWSAALLATSLGALVLLRRWALGTAGLQGLVAGLLLTLFAILLCNEGCGVAVAVLVWCFTADAAGAEERRRRILALSSGILIAFAAMLISRRLDAHGAWIVADRGFLFGWPWNRTAAGVIVWLPLVLVCLGIRPPTAAPLADGALRLLAIWAVSQLLLGSTLATHPWDESFELLFGIAIIAAGCALAWVRGGLPRFPHALAGGLWVAVVAAGLLEPGASRASLGLAPDDPMLRWLSREVQESKELSDPRFLTILPPSLQPGLRLKASALDGASGFDRAGLPTVEGRDGLPARGDFGSKGTGPDQFVSEPITSGADILQFRVSGRLAPGAASLVLRSADGKTIKPSESVVDAADHWRRINFRPPKGEFQVVAENPTPSESLWLAFTDPQQVEMGSWLALKFVRPAFVWSLVGIGTVLALAGLVGITHEPVGELPWTALPWAALAGYALFFLPHLNVTAAINDAGGYLNAAKLFASGHASAAPRMIWGPAQGETDITPYVPTQFLPMANGRLAPEYPSGLPLEIAAMSKMVTMPLAVPLILMGHLLLGIFFTWRLGRAAGLSRAWSCLAAGIVGLSAVYLLQGMQPQSDVAALVWITAAILWAWSSRQKDGYALASGLAVGMAVLVRPADLLCVVPALLCLGLNPRRLGLWAVGGLPAAGWLLWYDHTLFGSLVSTGYGEVASLFSPKFLLPTLLSYLKWLPLYFTPLIVAGFAGPFIRNVNLRLRVALTTWVGMFMVFYAFYYCTYDTWFNMRFVLPCLPAAAVLAAAALAALCQRWRLPVFESVPSRRLLTPSVLLVLVLLAWDVETLRVERLFVWTDGARTDAAAAKYVAANVPDDAVVYAHNATGPLTYYTTLTMVRFDSPAGTDAAFLSKVVATGRPVYAASYAWESSPGATQTPAPGVPGQWREVGACANLLLWKLVEPSTRMR